MLSKQLTNVSLGKTGVPITPKRYVYHIGLSLTERPVSVVIIFVVVIHPYR
jgi:hypothetical protein